MEGSESELQLADNKDPAGSSPAALAPPDCGASLPELAHRRCGVESSLSGVPAHQPAHATILPALVQTSRRPHPEKGFRHWPPRINLAARGLRHGACFRPQVQLLARQSEK